MDRFERLVDDEFHADGCCQMGHDIADADQLQHGLTVQDRVVYKMKQRILGERLNIRQASRREVVNDVDLIAEG